MLLGTCGTSKFGNRESRPITFNNVTRSRLAKQPLCCVRPLIRGSTLLVRRCTMDDASWSYWETYALAPPEKRKALVAATPAVTEQQILIKGLDALHNNDLEAAKHALEALKKLPKASADYKIQQFVKELEARVTLGQWDSKPECVKSYLQDLLKLSWDQQQPQDGGAAPDAATTPVHPCSLDPQLIAPEAVLRNALDKKLDLSAAALPHLCHHNLPPTELLDKLNSRGQGPLLPGFKEALGKLATSDPQAFLKYLKAAASDLTLDELQSLAALAPSQITHHPDVVMRVAAKLAPELEGSGQKLSQQERVSNLEKYYEAVQPIMMDAFAQHPGNEELLAGVVGVLLARLGLVESSGGQLPLEVLATLMRFSGGKKLIPGLLMDPTGRHTSPMPLIGAIINPASRPVTQPGPLNREVLPLVPPVPVRWGDTLRRLMYIAISQHAQAHPDDPPNALFSGPDSPLYGLLEPHIESFIISKSALLIGRWDSCEWGIKYTEAGGDLKKLQSRCELDFSAANPTEWAPDQEVTLTLNTKAVTSLLVKVYKVNEWEYFKLKNEPLSVDIDLEGLGPTWEVTHTYSDPPLHRLTRVVSLPQLTGRGSWVVDVMAGAQRCRAIIRKGGLRHVERCSAAGQALTVMYEDGSPAAGARAWLGLREYCCNTLGEVVLPFAPEGSCFPSLVLGDENGLACQITAWEHTGESYELSATWHLEREAAAGGAATQQVPLTCFLSLSLLGASRSWPAPLSLVTDITLTITATDLEGASSQNVINDLQLEHGGSGGAVLSQVILLPDRCGSVSASVSGRIQLSTPGANGQPRYNDLKQEASWQLAPQIKVQGQQVGALAQRPPGYLYLSMTPCDGYKLSLLGYAGEAIAGATVTVDLYHRFLAGSCTSRSADVTTRLTTDAQGSVLLGQLKEICLVKASAAAHRERWSGIAQGRQEVRCSWSIEEGALEGRPSDDCTQPSGRGVSMVEGEEVRLAYPWYSAAAPPPPSELITLRRVRAGECLADVSAEGVRLEPGYVVLGGKLAAGNYQLTCIKTGQHVSVTVLTNVPPTKRLTRGSHSFAVAPGLSLELSQPQTVQVLSLSASVSEGICVQLGGSPAQLAATSVDVVLQRFMTAELEGVTPLQWRGSAHAGTSMLQSQGVWPWSGVPSTYVAGRQLAPELQYVLERRARVKEGGVRAGCLLPRPSLLSHAQEKCQAEAKRARTQAMNFGFSAASAAPMRERAMACAYAMPCGLPPAAGMWADEEDDFGGGCGGSSGIGDVPLLNWCAPALVLPLVHMPADGSGLLVLTPAELQRCGSPDLATSGFSLVRVVVHAPTGVLRASCSLAIPPPVPAPPVSRTSLLRAFPGGSVPVEERRAVRGGQGDTVAVNDVTSAKYKVYDQLAQAWALFQALNTRFNGNSDSEQWAVFHVLLQWPSLPAGRKAALLAGHACHELHFWALMRDRAFYEAHVLPLLRLKLPANRHFLDDWMTGQQGLAAKWGNPKGYACLNVFERLLLAYTCGGAAALRRLAADVRDTLKSTAGTGDRQKQLDRFEMALKEGELQGPPEGKVMVGAAAPQPESKVFSRDLDRGERLEVLTDKSSALAMNAEAFRMQGRSLPARAMVGAAPPQDLIGSADIFDHDLQQRSAMQKQSLPRPAPRSSAWGERGWCGGTAGEGAAAGLGRVRVSEFWAEYAEHLAGQLEEKGTPSSSSSSPPPPLPLFVPSSLHSLGANISDALLALAVLDLSWQPVSHALSREGVSLKLVLSSPALVYVKQSRAAQEQEVAAAKDFNKLMMTQRIIDVGDMTEKERRGGMGDDDDEGIEEVTGPLQVGRLYALLVLMSSRGPVINMDVTITAPEGALTLAYPPTWMSPVHLDACETETLLLPFYFPAPGTFSNYPVAATRQGRVLAVAAAPDKLEVLTTLPADNQPSSFSWPRLAARGSAADVLTHLEGGDLSRLGGSQWGALSWRCRDKSFFEKATAVLRRRSCWPQEIWCWSLYHQDKAALPEYLLQCAPLITALGPAAVGAPPLMAAAPLEPPQHLEFWPLINPRAHMMPGEGGRAELPAMLVDCWQQLVALMVRLPEPPQDVMMQALLGLIAMDRLDAASTLLERLRASPPLSSSSSSSLPPLALDYLDTWMKLAGSQAGGGDVDALLSAAADVIARHGEAAAGDVHWERRFSELQQLVQDVMAVRGGAVDAGDWVDVTKPNTAAAAPYLSVQLKSAGQEQQLTVSYTSISKVALNLYALDLELMFSADPFGRTAALAGGGAAPSSSFTFIRPTSSVVLDLPPPDEATTALQHLEVDLEATFGAVMHGGGGGAAFAVEAVSGDLRSSVVVAGGKIRVAVQRRAGTVTVHHRSTGRPIVAAYVKVFARMRGGGVEFYKDGYTDLRGAFDVATLSATTSAAEQPTKFAVLVVGGEGQGGATALEVDPPGSSQ